MNMPSAQAGEPVEALLELELLLIPAINAAATRRWGLVDGRVFWRYDAGLKQPLRYGGPDDLVVRGAEVPVAQLAQAAALALLRYVPAPEPGLYDLICQALAADLAWELALDWRGSQPALVPLARELLHIDPELAARVRALGDTPPPVSSVAPVVFDQRLPAWLRQRLRRAALLTETPEVWAARREAGLWRWLGATRFDHLWPALVSAVEARVGIVGVESRA